MKLRHVFLTLVLIPCLLTAGTVGWLFLGGPLHVQSNGAATIPDTAASENGFRDPSIDHIKIERNLSYNGVSKKVNVSIYKSQAGKQAGQGGAAVLAITLPAWRVGGLVNMNPLSYAPLEQMFTHVFPHLPMDTPTMTKVDETQLTVDGTDTTVGKYKMTTTQGGNGTIYITRTTIDGDLVFLVGGHTSGDSQQTESIFNLMSSITHEKQ